MPLIPLVSVTLLIALISRTPVARLIFLLPVTSVAIALSPSHFHHFTLHMWTLHHLTLCHSHPQRHLARVCSEHGRRGSPAGTTAASALPSVSTRRGHYKLGVVPRPSAHAADDLGGTRLGRRSRRASPGSTGILSGAGPAVVAVFVTEQCRGTGLALCQMAIELTHLEHACSVERSGFRVFASWC